MCPGSIRPGSLVHAVAPFPSLPLLFLSRTGGRLEEINSTNGICEVRGFDDANEGIQGKLHQLDLEAKIQVLLYVCQ